MKCPYCGNVEDKVVDSRSARDNEVIRRRRECLNCEHRFTTYEYIEDLVLSVVKNDGRREPFERKKLNAGLAIACAKRPISVSTIESIVQQIEDFVRHNYTAEVPSKVIGHEVMESLKTLDDIAYVRFASVYRKFDHKEEFVKELNSLKNKTS